jgi:hypothetical protein
MFKQLGIIGISRQERVEVAGVEGVELSLHNRRQVV